MFLKKIWFLICGLFCLFNLYNVYKDSNSVEYTKSDKKEQKELTFSFCIQLNSTFLEEFKSETDEYRFTVKSLISSTY